MPVRRIEFRHFAIALIRALKDFAGRIENAVEHKPKKSSAVRQVKGEQGPSIQGEESWEN